MPFIPAANTVMAELRYILNNQKVENTLHFYDVSGWTLGSMATLATDLFSWWSTYLKAQQSSQTTLNEIYVTDLNTSSSPTHSYVPASGNIGTAVGTVVPNNVTLCVSLRTAARGRSARGRNFTVGMIVNQQVNGIATPAYVTAIETAYQALASGAAATPGVLAVASRYENNAPRASALVRPVVSAVVVDNVTDSQRRRLPSRGT